MVSAYPPRLCVCRPDSFFLESSGQILSLAILHSAKHDLDSSLWSLCMLRVSVVDVHQAKTAISQIPRALYSRLKLGRRDVSARGCPPPADPAGRLASSQLRQP
jgi:hypothetical protein